MNRLTILVGLAVAAVLAPVLWLARDMFEVLLLGWFLGFRLPYFGWFVALVLIAFGGLVLLAFTGIGATLLHLFRSKANFGPFSDKGRT